jgi:hypothetical protein
MSIERVFGKLVCRCDRPECENVWVAVEDVAPKACGKCKSRKWNTATPEWWSQKQEQGVVVVPSCDCPTDGMHTIHFSTCEAQPGGAAVKRPENPKKILKTKPGYKTKVPAGEKQPLAQAERKHDVYAQPEFRGPIPKGGKKG